MKPTRRRPAGAPAPALVPALAVALVLAFGCGSGSRGSSPSRPNVLLVTIDTLRADRLGAYGYDDAATPRIDALAASGIRFETVVAPAPLTLPSHASLLSSTWPGTHGVRDNASYAIPEDVRFLSEIVSDAGYDTAAFVGAYVLHSRFGLARGFDLYDDVFRFDEQARGGGIAERRGGEVVDSAEAWLRSREGRPFFAWVHLFDPHDPYDPPDPYRGRFAERPYDGEVAYADALVGRLVDAVSLDDTIVVVTADHGEGLGDHDEPTHGLFVYDATLLVPLIVRLPAGPEGREVTPPVRLVDVAPTILDAMDHAVPESFQGRSLLPLARGETVEALPAYSESFAPRFHFGWSELHAIRRDGYKLIRAPRPELYHLVEDPGETTNLFESEPDRAGRLSSELEAFLESGLASGAAARSGLLTASEQRALGALGYMSGAAPATASELADPKDKLDLYLRYNRGTAFLSVGRPDEAERELAGVVAEDESIVSAWLALGNARIARADYSGAIEALEAALERNPDYALARLSLGVAELGAGDRRAARSTFERLLAADPDDASAHRQLGEMALEEERPREALSHVDRALASHDGAAALHLMRGVALFQLGRVDDAAVALERAVALDPALPRAHFYLALVAETRGDGVAAVAAYRREVESRPDDFESWFNLSLKLGESGDLEGAITALRGATAARPEAAVGHIYLSRALLSTNDPARNAEAEAAARRGLSLSPPAELRSLAEEALAELSRRAR